MRALLTLVLLAYACSGTSPAQSIAPIQITNVREFTGTTFQHIPVAFECIDFKNAFDKPIRAFDLTIEFVDLAGKSIGNKHIHRTGNFAPGVEVTSPKNPNMDGVENCYRLESPGDGGIYRLRFVIDRAEFVDGSEWNAPSQQTSQSEPKVK